MVLSFSSKGNLARLIQLRIGLAHVTDLFLGIEKYAGNDRYWKLYCYDNNSHDLNLTDYSGKSDSR